MIDTAHTQALHRVPPRTPALLLGLGLGGFVDGIVMHQILQWHHMVSHVEQYPPTTLAGLEANTLADGVFHVGAWVLVLAGTLGMVAAWRAGRLAPSWSFHIGLLLVGWGVFNLVEGIVNHHVLGIHHVRDDLGAPLSWDIGFLVAGALLVASGTVLHLRGTQAPRRDQQPGHEDATGDIRDAPGSPSWSRRPRG
jgi:uncharacterized membrane protein